MPKWKGKICALITSSIIFTAFHIGRYQDINSLVNVFLLGIIFGIIYIATKSLYMSIGIHFVWDFYVSLFGTEKDPSLFILNSNISYINKASGWIQIIIKIIVIIIFISIYIKRKKLVKGSGINV